MAKTPTAPAADQLAGQAGKLVKTDTSDKTVSTSKPILDSK